MEHLTGLVAATCTPMHADGRLAVETIERLAERFLRDRVSGVFVCGTTGEFPALTMEERLQVAERWCDVAGSGLPVVVHVGGCCLAECETLAAHAQRKGADAIAAVAPYFLRPRTIEELVDFSGRIAAAAPRLPFYYYHIPRLSHVEFPMIDLLEASVSRIPNLAGIKYSDLDLVDLGRCVARGGDRIRILFGCDEALLSALALGVEGAVGTTYGFAAPLYHGVLDAFRRGDLPAARQAQARSMEMVAVFERHGGHPAMKAAMKLVGTDCGPVRPPLRSLSPEEHAALEAELEAIGFREFCSPEPSQSVHD
ncbi:MAG: dihydrodipicolinate synthase family protein [Planctomycetota bacterium]|nr:dihydrodipicolinate synthase family protein [Planctomycetota bacterium]